MQHSAGCGSNICTQLTASRALVLIQNLLTCHGQHTIDKHMLVVNTSYTLKLRDFSSAHKLLHILVLLSRALQVHEDRQAPNSYANPTATLAATNDHDWRATTL
jgi:Zn-dependent peptidase ImmA (M78 family)